MFIKERASADNTTLSSSSSFPFQGGSRPFGHRSTKSVSSLPSELQKLSLHPPPVAAAAKDDMDVIKEQDTSPQHMVLPLTATQNHHQNVKTPSWLYPPNNRPTLLPPPPSSSSAVVSHHRPAGASHGRSLSAYTMPSSSSSRPFLPLEVPSPPPKNHHHRARHQTHRRAVSANTVDFLLLYPAPSTSTSSSTTTTSSTTSSSSTTCKLVRAQSDSPPEQRLKSPPLQVDLNAAADDNNNHNNNNQQPPLQRDAATGRYLCPYCNKAFSRPSSLRIHTYSHTGEKPFVCTEEGCGRRFSVQSNMRRHLRVHRLGRSSLKTSSPLSKS